ncbi:MAG: GumC family protein [Candidatus Acidiferrales bacterium]
MPVDNNYDESARSLQEYWEEYSAIALRRRWWILVPMFSCWAVVWMCGWLLPSTYRSDALILVEQQKVPEQYVVPNVTINLQDRLQSITEQVLSRTRLQGIIDEFHLYSSRGRLAKLFEPRDAVDRMRNDINIQLVQAPAQSQGPTAFKIEFSGSSPQITQQVNRQLTSLFINEDLETQQQLSESTTSFLENQLADARAQLEQQEGRVRAFKTGHLGDLPSELQSNVQILSGLQSEQQHNQQALDGARQQRLYLQSLIQQYETEDSNIDTGPSTPSAVQSTDRELPQLRAQLADERSRYTDDYPDVIALKDRIAKAEALRKKKILSTPTLGQNSTQAKSVDPVGVTEIYSGAPTPIMQAESQLKANQLEIQNYEKREKQLEAQVTAYQARLNQTPEIEAELADISRGYDESKANYDSLLQKQNQSQLATSLEQRQQGEQFQVLDPPSLPRKPIAPNHLLVSLGGLFLGAVIGCGLAALPELTNAAVRGRDLQELVSARVLVGIPHLTTPKEYQSLRRVRRLEAGLVTAMLMVIALGNLYAFYKG